MREIPLTVSSQLAKIAVSISALCLAGGAFIARSFPATAYELSILSSSPASMWILLTGSIIIATVVSLHAPSEWVRYISIGVGTLAIASVSAVPLLRNYHFQGFFDSLQHLGSVKDIGIGLFTLDTLYPGLHLFAFSLGEITGLSPERVLLLTVPIFVIVYVTGVVFAVRSVDANQHTLAISAAVSYLLLVIMTVRLPHLQPIPTVVALLYLPFAVGFLSNLLQRPNTRYAALLSVGAIILILLHPQHALVFIGGLLLIGLAGSLASHAPEPIPDSIRPSKSDITVRAVILPLTLSSVILAWWLSSLENFGAAVANVVLGAYRALGFVPDDTQGGRLDEVGGTTFETVMRVFPAHIIFALTTTLVLAAVIYRLHQRRETPTDPIILYLSIMIVPAFGLFAVFAVVGRLEQALRYIGFVFVIGTLISSVGLAQTTRRISNHRPQLASIALAALLILSLIAMVPGLYQDPYTFQPNPHVTQGTMEGYDWMAEYETDTMQVATVSSQFYRFRGGAIGNDVSDYGTSEYVDVQSLTAPPDEDRVDHPFEAYTPFNFANQSLGTHYEKTTYVTVNENDRQRNVDLWDGVRYSENDFAYLDQSQYISRTYTNDEFNLYRVEPTDDDSTEIP
ncbi:hypothetical protein G6M89_20790 [Natronolimnobius sp. AArcel1]|uniref:hypothetical protein n=1 Tax=Natronolimnobius sp. AArcel1 TaxID=1679093 RepID=UPI0013ED52B4|nr:hypothetical protein [Natronolimnobius sp. AArcel1]NGM71400.1 hypothetical protein [Natronolimnobius sp. AArcel1]